MTEFKNQVMKPYRAYTDAEEWKLYDLLDVIEKRFGLVSLSEEEEDELWKKSEQGDKDALRKLNLALTVPEMRELDEALKDLNNQRFCFTLIRILNGKAGIGWTSDAHTGIPVPVYAKGVLHGMFSGYYDNTDIAKKLAAIMGIENFN